MGNHDDQAPAQRAATRPGITTGTGQAARSATGPRISDSERQAALRSIRAAKPSATSR